MKTIGIIGGIGPESTIDYYRRIIAAYRERQPDGSYPRILINSIDLTKLRGLMEAGELEQVTAYVVEELQPLARAGAECGLIAANSPHMAFDEIQRRSPIPLVSIVEATCEAAKLRGLKRLGLLGARFTMQGRFYPQVFSREGMAIFVPPPEEQAYIHEKYFAEFVKGIFLPETRKRLLEIIDGMIARDKIQGLILGGTELPLILSETYYRGLPMLDTAAIHVEAIVKRAMA
jgi:aspartate racemase